MAQFIETNRGGKNLHFEGYVYTKIRDGANSLQFWRSQNHKAGCPAKATSEGSSVVVRRDHDHPPNLAQSTTAQAIEGMRKRARDESTSINVIYDDQLEVRLAKERILLTCWHNCQALSQSGHVSTDPDMNILQLTLPIHRRDVSLSGRYTKTCSGEDFLLVDDGDDDKIMIFATEENLRLMAEADAFFIDGTFSTCPSLFYQVFHVV